MSSIAEHELREEGPERRLSFSGDCLCPPNKEIETSMGESDLDPERGMRAQLRPARTMGYLMGELDLKKEYKDEGWWHEVDQLAKVWQHKYAIEAINWAIKIGKGIDQDNNKETNLQWKMIQCKKQMAKAIRNGDEGAFDGAVGIFSNFVGCVMAAILERGGAQLYDMAIKADSRKAKLARLICGWYAQKESVCVDGEGEEVTRMKKYWEVIMKAYINLDMEEMSSQGSRWIEEVEKELNSNSTGNSGA